MENRDIWDMGAQMDAFEHLNAGYAGQDATGTQSNTYAGQDAAGTQSSATADQTANDAQSDAATGQDAADMQPNAFAAGQSSGQTITSRVCPRGYSRYTWRTGDTLESVARRYGVTTTSISEANPGIVFTRLNFGDEICIPFGSTVCSTGRLYTVRRGDTFTSIAARLGVSVYQLTELNPYVDPTTLQIGQLICVPAQSGSVVTPPSYTGGCTSCTGSTSSNACAADNVTILMPMGWSYATLLTRYGISYNALAAANPGLNLDAIPAGQRVCIPPMGSRQLCAKGTRSHVIAQGETLDTLAQRFNTTVARLLRINASLAPADFIAGQVICAPE